MWFIVCISKNEPSGYKTTHFVGRFFFLCFFSHFMSSPLPFGKNLIFRHFSLKRCLWNGSSDAFASDAMHNTMTKSYINCVVYKLVIHLRWSNPRMIIHHISSDPMCILSSLIHKCINLTYWNNLFLFNHSFWTNRTCFFLKKCFHSICLVPLPFIEIIRLKWVYFSWKYVLKYLIWFKQRSRFVSYKLYRHQFRNFDLFQQKNWTGK